MTISVDWVWKRRANSTLDRIQSVLRNKDNPHHVSKDLAIWKGPLAVAWGEFGGDGREFRKMGRY